MTHATLLRKALNAHGGTMEGFAAEVLGRSRSTVWRWLTGRTTMPPAVVTRLRAYLTSTTE